MIRLVLAVPVLFLVAFSIIPAFADTGVIQVVSGKTFQVSYNANGVKIQDIETNPTDDELTISVQVSSPNASLEITIPRALLDSKLGNADSQFLTVVDGTFVKSQEKTPTSTTRTISLPLTSGNSQIEIIGTYVAAPGPNGATVQTVPSPPSNSTRHQPVSPPLTTAIHHTSVVKNSTSNIPPTKKISNTQSQVNANQDIVFNIPYLPNVTIRLSPVDLAVIAAISLVVIIVITSAARKKPNKVVTSW